MTRIVLFVATSSSSSSIDRSIDARFISKLRYFSEVARDIAIVSLRFAEVLSDVNGACGA